MKTTDFVSKMDVKKSILSLVRNYSPPRFSKPSPAPEPSLKIPISRQLCTFPWSHSSWSYIRVRRWHTAWYRVNFRFKTASGRHFARIWCIFSPPALSDFVPRQLWFECSHKQHVFQTNGLESRLHFTFCQVLVFSSLGSVQYKKRYPKNTYLNRRESHLRRSWKGHVVWPPWHFKFEKTTAITSEKSTQ